MSMSGRWERIFRGLVLIAAAVALAMVLLCPSLLFLFPVSCFFLFFRVFEPDMEPAGYLSVVRSVCKIE